MCRLMSALIIEWIESIRIQITQEMKEVMSVLDTDHQLHLLTLDQLGWYQNHWYRTRIQVNKIHKGTNTGKPFVKVSSEKQTKN